MADRRHGDTALSSAAIEFMLCQAFATEVMQQQKAGASEEEQAALLVTYRAQLSALLRPAASSLTEGTLPLDTLLATNHRDACYFSTHKSIYLHSNAVLAQLSIRCDGLSRMHWEACWIVNI